MKENSAYTIFNQENMETVKTRKAGKNRKGSFYVCITTYGRVLFINCKKIKNLSIHYCSSYYMKRSAFLLFLNLILRLLLLQYSSMPRQSCSKENYQRSYLVF